jgi:hypothetical protein
MFDNFFKNTVVVFSDMCDTLKDLTREYLYFVNTGKFHQYYDPLKIEAPSNEVL